MTTSDVNVVAAGVLMAVGVAALASFVYINKQVRRGTDKYIDSL